MDRVRDLRESFRLTGLSSPASRLNRRAIDPHSSFLKRWHQVLLAGIVYELFVVPFVITFKPHVMPQTALEMRVLYAWEVLFVFDFYVTLHTGVHDDSDVHHHDLRKARSKYVTSRAFAFDVVSILPLSLLPAAHLGSVSPVVLEVPKLLLRLARVPAYLTNLDDLYAKHFGMLKLCKLVLGIGLLSHGVACVRFAFGYDTHHTNHWLPPVPATSHTPLRTYLLSLFWAFGVLSGLFEGELPHAATEFVFTIAVALGGFAIFTSLCATFFMLSKCESGSETEAADGRIHQLTHILDFHRVPELLRTQAVEYLRLYYTDADSNEREVMKLLCPSIATDIQIELMQETIARVPLFADCDSDAFVVALTSLLERVSLPAQCTLFEAGDFGDAMYIIHAGVLDVIVGHAKVRELRKHDFVGELSLFSSSPRTATVVTTTYCVLYKLSRFYTERVLEGYPREARTIATAVARFLAQAHEQKEKEAAVKPLAPPGPPMIEDVVRSGQLPLQSHRVPDAAQRRTSVFAMHLAALVQKPGSISLLRKKTSNAVTPIAVVPSGRPRDRSARKSIALNSPMPLLRRVLTTRKRKVSDSIKVFYDQYTHATAVVKRDVWWASLLLKQCIDAESTHRLWWLLVLQLVLVVNWIAIPTQLAFDLLDDPSWWIYTLNTVVDVVLFADMYVNMNLSYVHDAEKIVDPTRSAVKYLRSTFVLDLLCAFPYWIFAPSVHFSLTRIPRLFRIWRTLGHYQELDKIYHLHSRQRLVVFGLVLFLLIHVVCCLHFSVTHVEGFNDAEDSWLPCSDIDLRETPNGVYVDALNQTFAKDDPHVLVIARMQYARSFYYATNVLTGLGRTMEPNSDAQYAIALVFMFVGFLITAVVVDNVQKRFTASAFEQKQFFAVRSRIQLFLRRQNAPFAIHHRVNSFLDYWWAAHRGALISELLVDLPLGYRREILRSICKPALQTLALLHGVRPALDELEEVFVDHAQFILYGQDEVLYREGDNAHRLFFLLEGAVALATQRSSISKNKHVPQGSCFGTRALQINDGNDAVAQTGYAETAVAASGCVVLCFSRAKIELLHSVFPTFATTLTRLEKRLLDTKLSKSAIANRAGATSNTQSSNALVRFVLRQSASIDPDSKAIAVWETWLFFAMTIQWVLVILHIFFGTETLDPFAVDAGTVVLEAFFLIDMYVRTRLGYHEFGNKVMDGATIRRTYFRSRNFVVDLVALLPLFMLNWTTTRLRLEIFNINKLVRLVKVPTQFQVLEQRSPKFAMELRLFKLLYYTFLLAHIFGSLYFDFAAHASQVYSLSTGDDDDGVTHPRATNFGTNKWLLPATLEHASTLQQYCASVFWAFGLMSASQQGELPKTSVQCVFSVITMTSGFFLFAYVIGNFADILELVDAENRAFNEKLGSMRHLLAHFTIPPSIAAKMKTCFFFKRFHSITQEELLERCLPPSLMTDIRLLNLRSMIDKVPFLGTMDDAVTRMLVSHFNQVLVLKDDYVYRQGDDGSDMFFVFTGILSVLVPTPVAKKSTADALARTAGRTRASTSRANSIESLDVKALTHRSDLTSGDFFGENALFTDTPRNAFVRATTSCILYALSRQSLEMVFELYPSWKKRVLQTVKVQQKQQRLNAPSQQTNTLPTTASDRVEQYDGASSRSTRLDTEADNVSDNGDTAFDSPPVNEIVAAPQRTASSVVVSHGVLRFAPVWVRALVHGVEAQSKLHLVWLRVITVCTAFVAVIVPYRLAFDRCDRWTAVATTANVLQVGCTGLFTLDIWVNWQLKESEVSIEIYEEKHRESYRDDRLLWDVLAALPVDYIALLVDVRVAFWLSLARCIKVRNLVHYLNEAHRQSVSYEWERFKTIWILYLLAMYWSACVYLGVASLDGYGTVWNGWLPTEHVHITDPSNPSSHELLLRVLRSLFFAVTAFVKKGRTFVPESTSTDVFSIAICFVGLLVMSFMIGEISSLYISYIGNEVKFRKDQIETELYLSRWKIGTAMTARVHLFLSTLWSSHRGVHYQHVFDELPRTIRRETVLHIAEVPMKALMTKVFRPLAHGDAASLSVLTNAVADALQFESYPRGEVVVREGTIPKGMYFVVKGHLVPSSATHAELCRTVRYKKGSYFGEQGLLGYCVSRVSVRAVKASDLLALSTDRLRHALQSHPYFSIALALVKELFASLRTTFGDRDIPRSRDVWASHLKKILVRQRMEWALGRSVAPPLSSSQPTNIATSDSETASGRSDSVPTLPYLPFSPVTPAGAAFGSASDASAATLPKGATLWSAVLAGVLDTDTPHTGLQMFESFLELVVPIGELYDKTVVDRDGDPIGSLIGASRNNGSADSVTRMRNVVQQIGLHRATINRTLQRVGKKQSQNSDASQRDTEQLVHETELVVHALSHVNELKGVPPKYAHMQLPPLVVASIAEPVNGSSEHGIDADAASQ